MEEVVQLPSEDALAKRAARREAVLSRGVQWAVALWDSEARLEQEHRQRASMLRLGILPKVG